MYLWEKIRRYLVIWGLILLFLVVAAVAVYWKEIGNVMSAEASALFSGIMTVGLILGGIIYLLRLVFR